MTARSAGPPIVIAEDDADILAAVRDAIRSDELQVATARTASAAIEAIHFHRPSVVVVDVAMDGRRGWDVLRASTRRAGMSPLPPRPPPGAPAPAAPPRRGWDVLRASPRRAGMSALALDRSSDALARRAALACGADDVVGAPFDAEEIAARVRALVQRQLPDARGGPVYRHRDLVLDLAAPQGRVGGAGRAPPGPPAPGRRCTGPPPPWPRPTPRPPRSPTRSPSSRRCPRPSWSST